MANTSSKAPPRRRAARTKGAAPWRGLIAEGRRDSRLVATASEGPSRGSLQAPPPELHPDVLKALAEMGMEQLYAHQREAVYAAWEGPTIVTTGTASGKSLCFNLPTVDVLCRDRRARALYLYPTKALAQDQVRALSRFGLTRAVRPSLYIGDTPRAARAEIRRSANVVLTNPDMLHVGILPHHAAWADFFANLAVVVVDEAHVYRGVFGSHVANVMRRLRRVADAYGTAPRFLLASATIANPVELAERLTGLDGSASDRSRRRPRATSGDRGLEPAPRGRAHRGAATRAPGGDRARRARSCAVAPA